MPELTPGEKIQPCLLARLTDEDRAHQEESRNVRVITMQRYRDAVLRDIRWLLNAKRPRATEGLQDLSEISQSVLNYGVPDLCGLTTSELNISELERAIEQALKAFEPRILRHTLKVKAVLGADPTAVGVLGFEIRGQLWAQPIPEQLFIRTQLDLETGQCQLIS